MNKLKLLLTGIFVLFVVGLGWWIGSENTTPVSPRLFGQPLPEWTLGSWLMLTLLVGLLIGFFVSWFSYWKFAAQVRGLQRQLRQREQEIANLRTAGIRG